MMRACGPCLCVCCGLHGCSQLPRSLPGEEAKKDQEEHTGTCSELAVTGGLCHHFHSADTGLQAGVGSVTGEREGSSAP